MNGFQNYRLPIAVGLLGVMLGVMTVAQAEPTEYAIDNNHTHIVWEVDRFGFANTVGTFTDVSGNILFDEKNPERSSVTAQITLASLRSDLSEREEVVMSKYWLDAEHNPLVSFESEKVRVEKNTDDKGTSLTIEGKMALKGKTAPLVLHVTVNKVGTDPVTRRPAVGFSARGAFERSEFGIETALGLIGKTVNFTIQVVAIAKNESPNAEPGL